MGKTIHLTASDGHSLGAYRADPEGTPSERAPRGLIVVVQEIFGVNLHIRAVTDGFAADGYVAIAPQIFDRAEPDVELGYDAADVQRGRAIRMEVGFDGPVLDIAAAAALGAAEGLKVGVVGYCYGGALAWLAAARIDGLSAAIGYYGTAAAFKDEAPGCPVMLHYGDKDAMIPISDADDLKALYPDIQTFVYPADHGFNCDIRASHDAESATLARARTMALIGETVG